MSKVKLGEVAIEHKENCKGSKDGYPIVGLEHLVPKEVTLTAWDEGSDNTFTKMFRKGNVLFGRRRAYLKKAAVAPFDGICSGDITVIEAIPDYILPELLPFIIQNDDLFDFAVGKSAGSLSPRVKWEHLKNYEFELPDMDKQRELAELLWAMDATKKSYQKLIAATDELVKSQFMELFGNMGKDSKDFPMMPVADVCEELFAGGDKPADNAPEKNDEYPYPVYSNGEGPNGLLCFSRDYRVNKEAITISARGAIGYSAIREPFFTPVVRLLTVVPKENMNIVFLKYYIDASNLTGTGSSQGQLTLPEFKKLVVPIPPMDLQEQFAAFVRQSDKSKFELEQALSELTATYKRIIAENLG